MSDNNREIHRSILDAIGNTPMVRLNKIIERNGANVFAKLEYLNPAGSIKDRMALYIVEKAEREGKLKPGYTLVENTSGNTGAGLAIVAAVKGYKIIFTIPDKMSDEKINFLKAFGAKVIVTPTNVPADSPQSYYETAKRIAAETPDSFYVNQYHNHDNPEAHYTLTGPEIWDQMNGEIDYFVAGIGTGGTISGVGRFLKEKNPDIKIIAVDPVGSVFYDYYKSGKLIEPHVYKLEGIGEDMLVEAVDFSVIDDIIQVNDKQAFQIARKLARDEGIFGGGSSGAAVWGAVAIAEGIEPHKNVVTVLPDTGFRYLSKFFRDEWMRDNVLIEEEEILKVSVLIKAKKDRKIYSVSKEEKISSVISKMKQFGISQMPVVNNGEVLGLIHESDLLQSLLSENSNTNDGISGLMKTDVKIVESDTALHHVAEELKHSNAVVVKNGKEKIEIITRIDLIDYLASNDKEHIIKPVV